MNAESFRELLERRPFEPFEVLLTTGERYPVRLPENAILGRTRLVVYSPESDKLAICSLLHIATIEVPQPKV